MSPLCRIVCWLDDAYRFIVVMGEIAWFAAMALGFALLLLTTGFHDHHHSYVVSLAYAISVLLGVGLGVWAFVWVIVVLSTGWDALGRLLSRRAAECRRQP